MPPRRVLQNRLPIDTVAGQLHFPFLQSPDERVCRGSEVHFAYDGNVAMFRTRFALHYCVRTQQLHVETSEILFCCFT